MLPPVNVTDKLRRYSVVVQLQNASTQGYGGGGETRQRHGGVATAPLSRRFTLTARDAARPWGATQQYESSTSLSALATDAEHEALCSTPSHSPPLHRNDSRKMLDLPPAPAFPKGLPSSTAFAWRSTFTRVAAAESIFRPDARARQTGRASPPQNQPHEFWTSEEPHLQFSLNGSPRCPSVGYCRHTLLASPGIGPTDLRYSRRVRSMQAALNGPESVLPLPSTCLGLVLQTTSKR